MCETDDMQTNLRRSTRWLVALGGLSIVLLSEQCLAQTGGSNSSGKAAAVPVETVKPVRRPLVRALRIPASLSADEQVDLYAKVSGYVAGIDVDIGSRVSKGDELIRLSVPEMLEELKQAEALLAAKQSSVRAMHAKTVQAERLIDTAKAEVRRHAAEHDLEQINLNRKKELHEGGAIPAQALDEARSAFAITEAQLEIARARVAGAEAEKLAADADAAVAESDVVVAQASLARLRKLMEYASIKAPFDGVVTMRHVDPGAFVRSAAEGVTTSLLRVAKTDRIRIVLQIPESDAAYVRIGTHVDVEVPALDEPPFPGTVSRTAGALKPETRTMRAEVDIDNRQGRFAAGMYARVVVKLETKSQAMVIPSKAVRVRGKDTSVLIAANGVAKSMPIVIGYDDGIWAEILSGLDGGESVITATGGAVAPGTAVLPSPSNS